MKQITFLFGIWESDFNISIFSHIFQSFSKNCIIHQPKRTFFKFIVCFFGSVFLPLKYVFSIFFYKYKTFLHFQMIPSALLLITFFILLKLIIFLACSLKNSQNIFIQSFPLYTSCLFSIIMLVFYTFRWWYCRHSKTDVICSPFFLWMIF